MWFITNSFRFHSQHVYIRLCQILVISFIVFYSASSHSAVKGELEILNWEHPDQMAKVPVMRARYEISKFFGEPTEKYIFYYESIDDFTRISSISLRAQVTKGGQPIDAYVTFSPLIVEPGKWGWDVTGSPNWVSWMTSDSGTYLSESQTKALLAKDMGLANLEVVKIDISQSTEDDAGYDAFREYIISTISSDVSDYGDKDSRVDRAKAHLPLNKNLERANNFWKDRQFNLYTDNPMVSKSGVHPDRHCWWSGHYQSWLYAGFQHVAFNYSCAGGEELKQARIKTTIKAYTTYQGQYKDKLVETRRHSGFMKANGEILIVDRMMNRKGTTVPYRYEFSISFIEQDVEEELDPLAEIETPIEPLQQALEQDQLTRFQNENKRQQQGVEGVYADNEAAQKRREAEAEARRLAREQARKDKEAREAYLKSPQYKIDQQRAQQEKLAEQERVRQQKLDEQMQRQLAQQEKERKQQLASQQRAFDAKQKQIEDENIWRNLEPYQSNRQWGYRDRTTKATVIYPNYSEARAFREGRAWVRLYDERWMLIDHRDKKYLDSVKRHSDLVNGVVVYINYENRCVFADKNGKKIVSSSFKSCDNSNQNLVSRNLIMGLSTLDRIYFYNAQGKEKFVIYGSEMPSIGVDEIVMSKFLERKGACGGRKEKYRTKTYDFNGRLLDTYVGWRKDPVLCLQAD